MAKLGVLVDCVIHEEYGAKAFKYDGYIVIEVVPSKLYVRGKYGKGHLKLTSMPYVAPDMSVDVRKEFKQEVADYIAEAKAEYDRRCELFRKRGTK